MFRQLAVQFTADALFKMHPIELATLLEQAWEQRRSFNPALPLGHPLNRSNVKSIPAEFIPPGAPTVGVLNKPAPWDHLAYAYMVENTKLFEVFRRVVYEFLHGEKLSTPNPDSQPWLRATEDLFYRDPAPFAITAAAGYIRPDLRANRRNWYQRMFGMDLNHGGDDGKPYVYVKAEAANTSFVSSFEEFLREVWVGMTYVTATSSSNPTDPSKIAELATALHDQLRSRRQNGNLSREEFAAVSTMSWFHLALESPSSPIIAALRIDATGIQERLLKMAQIVRVPAHALCFNFFRIADPLSRMLIQIETGDFNDQAAVTALYTPGNSVESDMRNIIADWTAITGRDVKARKVAPS
jgi:hypothetical protein